MTRTQFDQQLSALQQAATILGEQVQTAIEQALQAFSTQDLSLARKVVAEDAGINRMESEILEQATTLLALQAPVASDLRRILGITRIAGNLERMGDHARDIATTTIRLGSAPSLEYLIDLPAMLQEVLAMVREGQRCLSTTDTEHARIIGDMDEQVDHSYGSLVDELLGYMLADSSIIKRATYTMFVAHDMERIADRVTNIAESVIYIVTGKTEELN